MVTGTHSCFHARANSPCAQAAIPFRRAEDDQQQDQAERRMPVRRVVSEHFLDQQQDDRPTAPP